MARFDGVHGEHTGQFNSDDLFEALWEFIGHEMTFHR